MILSSSVLRPILTLDMLLESKVLMCAYCAVSFFLASCSPASPRLVSSMPVSMQEDTTLGPNDVFDIRVYGEPDLSDTHRVSSDGTIDYPLIGNIVVKGMTPTEVSQQVENLLVEGEFLKAPQVSVFVKEYNSNKVSVFGEVNKSGTFAYQDGMGVVEVISLAGGFTPMAKTSKTVVTRVENGKKQNYVVPVEEIGRGKTADFILRPGDIIFVPERAF